MLLKNYKTCIIAGSFDPFTNGHLELVNGAEEIYKEVIIVIADNDSKNYMFSKAERMRIVSLNVDNKVVDLEFDTLGDYARDNNYDIVKGVRNESDIYYEDQLAMFNKEHYDVTTKYIETTGEVSLISSSYVKLAYKHNIDIGSYVHQYVQKRFNEMNHLTIVGITGGIASGKSTFIKNLYKYHTIISMDDLAKTIYERKTTKHIELTDRLIKKLRRFDIDATPENLTKKLREVCFIDKGWMEDIDSVLGFEIKRLLMRRLTALNNSTGSHSIVIECASFDKYPYLIDVCNHDVTYLLQSDDVRKEYLMKRDNITRETTELVIETLGDDESKINAITKYHDESLGRFRVLDINLNEEHCKKMFDVYHDYNMHNFIRESSMRDAIIQYSSSDRFYHDCSHVLNMITEYSREEKLDNGQVATLILYHDYYQKCDDAEEKSALKLEEDLITSQVVNGINPDLIRHTKTHGIGTSLNKLDLSILNSDEETYNEYKSNIRKEYSEYSDKEYAFGRIEVLNELLKSRYIKDGINIKKEIDELIEVLNGDK